MTTGVGIDYHQETVTITVTKIESTVRSVVFSATNDAGGASFNIDFTFLGTGFNPVPVELRDIFRPNSGRFASDAALQAALKALEFYEVADAQDQSAGGFFFLFGSPTVADPTLPLSHPGGNAGVTSVFKIKHPHTLTK